jgi:hypothetical protein
MPLRLRTSLLLGCLLSLLAFLLPTAAFATVHKTGGAAAVGDTGGASPDDPRYAPGKKAKIVDGLAVAPAGAPPAVRAVIDAGNKIIRKPYHYGGGHGNFKDSGYDCSGSVSFALHGGGLLRSPLDSSSFMHWGQAGKGTWITVYTNPGHAFLQVAGIRLDTGGRDGTQRGAYPGSGPRWGALRNPAGFQARHPAGF